MNTIEGFAQGLKIYALNIQMSVSAGLKQSKKVKYLKVV